VLERALLPEPKYHGPQRALIRVVLSKIRRRSRGRRPREVTYRFSLNPHVLIRHLFIMRILDWRSKPPGMPYKVLARIPNKTWLPRFWSRTYSTVRGYKQESTVSRTTGTIHERAMNSIRVCRKPWSCNRDKMTIYVCVCVLGNR
jgi:hypothetical protein